MELVAPVTLNVVCFRYTGIDLADARLDGLNEKLLGKLQEQGIAAPSVSTVKGKYVLHIAHTNRRSRRKDFDLLVREVRRIGQVLAG